MLTAHFAVANVVRFSSPKLSKTLIVSWSWQHCLCNTVRRTRQWSGFETSKAGNIKNAAPYDVESSTSWVASSVPAKNIGSASSVFCSKIAVGSRLSNITISSHEAKI